jgi:hypothetical protein
MGTDSFSGGGGTVWNQTRRVPTKTRAPAPRPAAGNAGWGDALRRNLIAGTLERTIDPRTGRGTAVTNATLNAADKTYLAGSSPYRNPSPLPRQNTYTGSGGSGGGGGGGGGGGAAPGIDQAMLDWLAGLLGRGGPQAQTATAVDLPEFTGTFDPSVFNQKRTAWNEAVGRDVGTAEQATQNILGFLGQNYKNAYTDPNNTYATAGQAPGMTQQAMAKMLSGQGVDPSVMAAEAASRAGADQAFGNLWRSSAANEDIGQRNRLNTATLSGQDAINRLRETGLAGTAGLNMGEATARSAFEQQAQERNWQTQQQEALANWQRQNQVADTNQQNTAAYRNQVLQSLLSIFPNLAGTGLTLPGAETLGF